MTQTHSWSADTATDRLADIKRRIANKEPALNSVFTQTFFDQAEKQCEELHRYASSPLCGALVSVKDLFDVDGFVTKAGTTFMADDPPATTDAPPINNLKKAGAVLVGHTNMTELAFSGLGLNPHYGTPENAITAGCIPGGSSSGGAVSVAQGAADIAIGTDTGGSVRIPAAFNGIVGFKPTQSTVSRKGCKALSRTLDSIGPMARSVSACELAYRALASSDSESESQVEEKFIVPTNYGMHDLAPAVATTFNEAVQKLKNSGYNIAYESVESLEALNALAIWHFAAVESRGEYEDAYQTKRHMMDRRISGPTRMGRADGVDAIAYRQTLNQRQDLIGQYRAEMGSRILLMPTVPILAPSFSDLEEDDEYTRINMQVLRNTTIGNVMDCCSISLPFTFEGVTIGVMMTATAGHDLSLLRLSTLCEQVFDSSYTHKY